jgi:hypothetical protein
MALRIDVDAVDQIALGLISTAEIDLGVNRRGQLTLSCLDGLLPDRMVEVIMYEKDGVTPLFGGVALVRDVHGEGENQLETRTDLTVPDFSAFCDWCAITVSYDTPVALEDVLTDIAAVLAAYGISYTPTATGITLEAFSWEDVVIADALRQLTERTGYVFSVSPTKTLDAILPGATPAPVSITDANANAFDLRWRDNATPEANTVVLVCGPSGQGVATQRWTADGIVTAFEVDIQAVIGGWQQGYILEDGATVRTLSGPGEGGYYEWDPSTGRGTVSVGAGATPGAGVVLELVYTAQFPFRVTRTTGATPRIESRIRREDLTEYAPAVETAEGLLDRVSANTRDLEIITDVDGFKPGQALTINTTARGGIVGVFLIAAVRIVPLTVDQWTYTLTAQASDTYQGSVVDEWRAILGGGGSSASTGSLAGVVLTPTTLASPAFLGGARNAGVAANPAAWVTVPNYVPYVAPASFTGRLRVEIFARNAGVTVTARLFDVTAAAAVMTTSGATSQAPVEKTAVGPIVAGHTYRLEIQSGTNGEAVFGIGSLETV